MSIGLLALSVLTSVGALACSDHVNNQIDLLNPGYLTYSSARRAGRLGTLSNVATMMSVCMRLCLSISSLTSAIALLQYSSDQRINVWLAHSKLKLDMPIESTGCCSHTGKY